MIQHMPEADLNDSIEIGGCCFVRTIQPVRRQYADDPSAIMRQATNLTVSRYRSRSSHRDAAPATNAPAWAMHRQ